MLLRVYLGGASSAALPNRDTYWSSVVDRSLRVATLPTR